MDIFRFDPIPVSPITARSESTRRFRQTQEQVPSNIGLVN